MNDLNNILDQARDLLEKSPSSGLSMLVESCRKTGNNEIIFKAIMLSGKYYLASAEKKEQIKNEAIALIDELSKKLQIDPGKAPDPDPGMKTNEFSAPGLKNQLVKEAPKYKTVFKCENIKKTYKKTDFILSGISLELKEGEITGVVGENGNGKSTLLKIIAGELNADEGIISYDSLSTNPGKINWAEVKSRIAYLPQELPPLRGDIKKSLQFNASLRGLKGRKNVDEVNYIIHRLGLTAYADSQWNNLSGGYKLRFALAKILVWKPSLLVLDEPLSNLDINTQMIILNDLRNMTDIYSNHMSVVISSQNLEEVEAIADKMIVIKKGELQFYGESSHIGIDRTVNTFEIKTPLEKDELQLKLRDLSYSDLSYNGFFYILNTPLQTDKLTFIEYCASHDIVLDHFSDISSSVKKLIIQTN